MVVSKDQLEKQLFSETQQISEGRLEDENPLDQSKSFRALCEACQLGDIKRCMELINEGVNINARDEFDYTPLILASLCGHYEVVQLLLESDAICQRNTFQGERCLYNALNDRIRNLLLGYDYSKTTHVLQPFASHINSLLSRERPETWDISLDFSGKSIRLHKFILAARSPYFKRKLAPTPGTKSLKLVGHMVPQALEIAIRFLYLGEVPVEIGPAGGTDTPDSDVPAAIEKLSRLLEMKGLWEGILEGSDRRIARQRRSAEIEKCRDQIEQWYRENVLRHQITIEKNKARDVRWDRENSIFADVLLCADEDVAAEEEDEAVIRGSQRPNRETNGIPIGPISRPSRSPSRTRRTGKSVLFPGHRAILIRSEFFMAMFSSSFKEAQYTEYLQIITVDCSPEVLNIVLDFLYTEQAEIPLDLAIEVLLAADMLLLDRLKTKAAMVISTLGNVSKPSPGQAPDKNDDKRKRDHDDTEAINIYDVIRAGWLTRMQRLDAFGAKYLASRLEDYIEEDEFADLIRESAASIKERQETDSIDLLDDIRFYLSERFRLRFEDVGLEEMLDEEELLKDDVVADDSHASRETSVKEASSSQAPTDTSHGVSKIGGTLDTPVHVNDAVGVVRTLEGDIAGDEFDADAINYRVLLGKIDDLLERLQLDA
ncbi:MAG: hypothetical protein M1816_006521 [Peltula sp. TS41687]|nr:MAG: hypothetical protein M1816_006521 [Peltula sp. TS41687]